MPQPTITWRGYSCALAAAAWLCGCGNDPGSVTLNPDGFVVDAANPDEGIAPDMGTPDFPIVLCGEEGVACDDGRGCTTDDRCEAGVCLGTARDCSALDGACFVGVCAEPGGICAATPQPDGTPCSDGIYCTTGDRCQALSCGGDWRDCSTLDSQCTRGLCDELGQACVALPDREADSCDDGLFCTVLDQCSRGLCLGVTRDCSVVADDCNSDSCDETIDTCVASAINEGGPCEDGLFCTVDELCTAGACIWGGVPRDCSFVADWCNVDSCDDTAAACVPVPSNEGGFCDDGFVCTFGQQCALGVCSGGAPLPCDDSNACTSEACFEPWGCQYTPLGPFPGLEGPVGDPTCSDSLDNDCDLRLDGADGNCVVGDPGVVCDTDVCFAPEVCCLNPPSATPVCTTTCFGFPASCDGAEDCPDSTCCLEVQVDVAAGAIGDAIVECRTSCPYTCDIFGGFLRSEPCDAPTNCASQPSCCSGGSLANGVCLDAFCADLLESSSTAVCEP